MDSPASRWELHARSGRAVLVGTSEREAGEVDPARLELPNTLVEALHEWAHVVDTVTRNGNSTSEANAEVVSQRGHQLAIRLAVETGGEVGYVDPLSGEVNRVGRQRPNRSASPAARRRGIRRRPGPTPWATGLTVSAIIGAIVVIALVVVTLGLAEVNVLLAAAVNLAVVAGLAPSIWLGRRVLVWRWVAFGTAGGIVLAWIALLLSALG
jgi:hypothetical protein